MEQSQPDVLTESLFQLKTKRRKDLLPWWIKVFIWIFLIVGAIALLGFIGGLIGFTFEISLYGLETNEPISMLGISVILLFLFKGFTAYSLLKESDWAIIAGIADALVGIILCSFTMLHPLFNPQGGTNFIFRLELLLLIPYFIKLLRIRPQWEKSTGFN